MQIPSEEEPMQEPERPQNPKSRLEAWFATTLARAAAYNPDMEIVIMSIIGRTELGRPSKASMLRSIIDTDTFERTDTQNPDSDSEIEAFFDPELHVIFLHLTSVHDSDRLVANLLLERRRGHRSHEPVATDPLDPSRSLYEFLRNREENFSRKLLFLFHVSHVVVLWHPTTANDVSYMRLFRTLESMRQDVRLSVLDALAQIQPPGRVPRMWAKYGRPCSPRLLCVYNASPVPYESDKRVNPMRRLETSLEDQLYNLLRSSRIITNDSGKSLFAVPFNLSFAHIIRPKEDQVHVEGSLFEILETISPAFVHALNATDPGQTEAKPFRGDADNLYDFLMTHVDQAFSDGFNDNVSRSVGVAAFEVPKLAQFVAIAPVLYSRLVRNEGGKDTKDSTADSLSQLSCEINFSENRCAKVYPYALSTYQEGLPPFYTAGEHEARLLHVHNILRTQARGPAVPAYVTKLTRECEAFWSEGRQACEVLSLRGNNCCNPRHELSEISHASKANTITTCSCGHRQSLRDDPFDLYTANQEFFWNNSVFSCCLDLKRHEYPVFVNPDMPSGSALVSEKHANLAPPVAEIFKVHQAYTAPANRLSEPSSTPDPQHRPKDNLEGFASSADQMDSRLRKAMTRSSDTSGTPFEEAAANTGSNEHNRGDSVNLTTGDRQVHDSQLSPPDVLDSNPENFDEPEEVEDEENDVINNEDIMTHNDDDDSVHGADDHVTSQGASSSLPAIFDEASASPSIVKDNENSNSDSGHKNLEPSHPTAPDSGTSPSLHRSTEEPRSSSEPEPSGNPVPAGDYISGIMYLQNPPDKFRPLFSSWSLVCVGPSSLYTHAMGLREQPNFSHGSAYLLPWDVRLTVGNVAKWQQKLDDFIGTQTPSAGSERFPRKRPQYPIIRKGDKGADVVVKLFVGFEYECPRGHRFMMQSAQKMLKHAGPSGPKDSASIMIKSDMPLWFPCSCRANAAAAFPAQLMRIHVITPKMPVNVKIGPRVQTDPASGVTFCPSAYPVPLPPAEYWILRLPFAYVHGSGTVFYPPKPGQNAAGRLLKGCLSVSLAD